jgi:hypothetical protein
MNIQTDRDTAFVAFGQRQKNTAVKPNYQVACHIQLEVMLMRKTVIWFTSLFLLVIIGYPLFTLWKSQQIHWVAPESQPMQYYVVTKSQAPKVGKLLGGIITEGISNGPLTWVTNMRSKNSILIYQIPNVDTKKEVAVEVNGRTFVANFVGSQKP